MPKRRSKQNNRDTKPTQVKRNGNGANLGFEDKCFLLPTSCARLLHFGGNPALRAFNYNLEGFRLAVPAGSSPADRAASQNAGQQVRCSEGCRAGRLAP